MPKMLGGYAQTHKGCLIQTAFYTKMYIVSLVSKD